MLYMVIEKFHESEVKTLYNRFTENGRMLPDDIHYINSWINDDAAVCYQVMESDTFENLQKWISNWNGIVDFEIIPVIISAQAKEKVFRHN